MNVQDVHLEPVDETIEKLDAIFTRQHQLAEKYRDIETRAGVGYGILRGATFNVHEQRSQEVCKNYAWRVVEEITEATLAIPETIDGVPLHAYEEVADALHFLVELMLLVGLTADDVDGPVSGKWEFLFKTAAPDEIPVWDAAYEVVEALGAAMNCLKQKPWKQTHVRTDVDKFTSLILASFLALIRLAKLVGLDARSLYDLYFRKAEVNSFRLRSHY